MTVAAAHSICDRIESTLKAEMGHLMITIHVEPEEKAKRCGIQVPPDGAAKNAARAGQHP
jgi:divalent metal cation (Fe/Co/Zn/Cd) transporter